MSILEFDDGIGGRLRGTLHAPGATPGDVLTVGATHGAISPSPGGGSQPVVGSYSGVPITINNGTGRALSFDSLNTGVDLLDRTTPDAPTFLAAGVYLMQFAAVSLAPLTAGGTATLDCIVGVLGGTMSGFVTDEATVADVGWGMTTFTVAQPGDTLVVSVTNRDGAAARDFLLSLGLIAKVA